MKFQQLMVPKSKKLWKYVNGVNLDEDWHVFSKGIHILKAGRQAEVGTEIS